MTFQLIDKNATKRENYEHVGGVIIMLTIALLFLYWIAVGFFDTFRDFGEYREKKAVEKILEEKWATDIPWLMRGSEDFTEGYEWAKLNNVRYNSTCENQGRQTAIFRMGCSTYLDSSVWRYYDKTTGVYYYYSLY